MAICWDTVEDYWYDRAATDYEHLKQTVSNGDIRNKIRKSFHYIGRLVWVQILMNTATGRRIVQL
jgi:hypothetical protein